MSLQCKSLVSGLLPALTKMPYLLQSLSLASTWAIHVAIASGRRRRRCRCCIIRGAAIFSHCTRLMFWAGRCCGLRVAEAWDTEMGSGMPPAGPIRSTSRFSSI